MASSHERQRSRNAAMGLRSKPMGRPSENRNAMSVLCRGRNEVRGQPRWDFVLDKVPMVRAAFRSDEETQGGVKTRRKLVYTCPGLS